MEVDGLASPRAICPGAPRRDIGGDLYDVFSGPRARHAVVGDVGEDVSAAAEMGQLRSVVRAIGMNAESPAELLASVDRYAHEQDTLYATLAVAVRFGPRHAGLPRRVAGHPPPLVVDAAGEARFADGGRNLPRSQRRRRAPYGRGSVARPGTPCALHGRARRESRTTASTEGLEAAARQPPPRERVPCRSWTGCFADSSTTSAGRTTSRCSRSRSRTSRGRRSSRRRPGPRAEGLVAGSKTHTSLPPPHPTARVGVPAGAYATPASRNARLSLSISRAITSRCTSWVPS